MHSVFVICPDRSLERLLRRELLAEEFRIVGCEPGPEAVEIARRLRPEIAVVVLDDSRRDVAALVAAILRVVRPDVRLILVSTAPSPADAAIVEAGVFYYMPGWLPAGLPEIVRAAERSRRVEDERQTRRGEILT
jgi:ActR/RegA family two-component response regulator